MAQSRDLGILFICMLLHVSDATLGSGWGFFHNLKASLIMAGNAVFGKVCSPRVSVLSIRTDLAFLLPQGLRSYRLCSKRVGGDCMF